MEKKRLYGHIEQFDLGIISERFETMGRGPDTVSSGRMGHGKSDPGGPSYGTYQLTSQDSRYNRSTAKVEVIHNGGNVGRFLSSDEGSPWGQEINGSPSEGPGTAGFTERWQVVARRDTERFAAAQQAYIGRTHFRPQMEKIQRETSLHPEDWPVTLQNVVWSTAVHHGPHTNIICTALKEKAAQTSKGVDQLTPHECIDAIYDKRAQQSPDLSPRFTQERDFAHKMLDAETRNPQMPLRSVLDDRAEAAVASGIVPVPLSLSEGLSDSSMQKEQIVGCNPDLIPVPQELFERQGGPVMDTAPAGKAHELSKADRKAFDAKAAKEQDPDINPLLGPKAMG